MKATITLRVSEYNGTPGLVIKPSSELDFGINIAPNSLSEGEHTLEFTFTPQSEILFYITGKNHNMDTQVDQYNNIVKDKHIQITNLHLQYINIGSNAMYKIGFLPYLGMNEQVHTLVIPPMHQWCYFYLDILEKLNA